MEQRIDRAAWRRNAHDRLFARLEVPFYSITFRLDVTDAAAWAKKHGVSFYLTMVWATMRAVNSVEAFRYELRGEEVWLLDHRNPSYTYPWDDELFGICGVEWINGESPIDFIARCRAAEKNSTAPLPTAEADAAGHDVYLSSLPWFDYEHITQEFPLNNADSTPRILWGKYETDEHGRRTLAYTVQVNHRLIDGIHLKRLYDALNGAISALEEYEWKNPNGNR